MNGEGITRADDREERFERGTEVPGGIDGALLPRLLQRRFPAVAGVGPKEFQRLARFQRTVRTVLLSGSSDYLATALDAGYYDQAHVAREFRRIAGLRPTELLAPGVSHFSYAPLPGPGETGRPSTEERS